MGTLQWGGVYAEIFQMEAAEDSSVVPDQCCWGVANKRILDYNSFSHRSAPWKSIQKECFLHGSIFQSNPQFPNTFGLFCDIRNKLPRFNMWHSERILNNTFKSETLNRFPRGQTGYCNIRRKYVKYRCCQVMVGSDKQPFDTMRQKKNCKKWVMEDGLSKKKKRFLLSKWPIDRARGEEGPRKLPEIMLDV